MKFKAEQIEKAAECTDAQELQALAKSEGIELTDAEAENYFLALKEGALQTATNSTTRHLIKLPAASAMSMTQIELSTTSTN